MRLQLYCKSPQCLQPNEQCEARHPTVLQVRHGARFTHSLTLSSEPSSAESSEVEAVRTCKA